MNDQCSVFCGRSCGQCASCQWGWSANPPHPPGNITQLTCQPCRNAFTVYDWLFVAFHVLCALLLHYQAIWRLSVTRWRGVAAEYASATVEVIGGFLLTIIVFPPFGSVQINACYTAALIQQDISKFSVPFNTSINLIKRSILVQQFPRWLLHINAGEYIFLRSIPRQARCGGALFL